MKTQTPDLTCSLVKELLTDWAKNRHSEPFPFQRVGDHLTRCVSCLSWATQLAYQPQSRYLAALRLKLAEALYLLGRSLLAVWSAQETVKIHFHVAPDDLATARSKVLSFLERYARFSPATRQEAEQLRQRLRSSDTTGIAAELEPYELVRHFFQMALDNTEAEEPPLDILVCLGIAENYYAWRQQQAGDQSLAEAHFLQARRLFQQVLELGPKACANLKSPRCETDRTALVAAYINLAMTEVLQGVYSEVALHRAINYLYEAKRRVLAFDLPESEYPNIPNNLLIAYLRLYLDCGIPAAYDQAWNVARETCATPGLGPVFLRDFVLRGADPELQQLLALPRVQELAGWLRQQAEQV